jgi:hypothetical protein
LLIAFHAICVTANRSRARSVVASATDRTIVVVTTVKHPNRRGNGHP